MSDESWKFFKYTVTDLRYELWFRDYACQFLWGKSQYFSSYLIIERSEALNPVTLQGAWD